MTWLVALCVMLWGPLDGLPRLACLRLPAPVSITAVSGHAPDCRCAQCPGGRACCCRPAKNAAQVFLMMCRCDKPQPVSFTAKINLPLPACLPMISSLWLPAIAPRLSTKNYSLRSFPLTPPAEPPRAA
jgi:hypothetical protein